MDNLKRGLALLVALYVLSLFIPSQARYTVESEMLTEATVLDKYTEPHYISTGKSVMLEDSYYLNIQTPDSGYTSVVVPVTTYQSVNMYDTIFVRLQLNKDGDIVNAIMED